MTAQPKHTPTIGKVFSSLGERWKIHRQDNAGIFWAAHQLEFSCSEIPVTGDAALALAKGE